MNDFICPKCNQAGLPSIYLPMCTACANIERRKSGEIKDDNAAQQSFAPDRLAAWASWAFWGIVTVLSILWLIFGGR